MKKLKYIFPVLFFLVASCNEKDNCDKWIMGESFTISKSTISHLSNYFDSEQVVFINNSNDEEVIFQITEKLDLKEEYISSIGCPDDPDESINVIGTRQLRQIQIQNTFLGITITVQHQSALATNVNPNAIEHIFILGRELNDLNNPLSAQTAQDGLLVVTPTLDVELFTIKTDTLSIFGEEFLDAEEMNPESSGFGNEFISLNLTVGYTKDEGIIYIIDKLTNSELVFERTE